MDGLPAPKRLRSSGNAYITPDADELQDVINEFKEKKRWTPSLRRRYSIAALGAYVPGRTCSSIIRSREERARRIAAGNELRLARDPPPAPEPVSPGAAGEQSDDVDTTLHTVCAESSVTSAVDIGGFSVTAPTLSAGSVADADAVPESNQPGCAAESLHDIPRVYMQNFRLNRKFFGFPISSSLGPDVSLNFIGVPSFVRTVALYFRL